MSNLTTVLPAAGAVRRAQVAGADWDTGMNPGTCQPGVGINTGDYSPKVQDWAEVVIAPGVSQYIGGIDPAETTGANTGVGTEGAAGQVDLLEPVDGNDTFAFVEADAETAADAVLDVTTGAVNRTGVTVPAAAWCWGTVPVV